jgi:hypothetical protein
MNGRLPCVIFLMLLSVAPVCGAQDVTVRLVNAENGHPLPKWKVSVSFYFEKKSPANHAQSLNLTSNENGEAHFEMPQPRPEHFSAHVQPDSPYWKCGCALLGSTEELLRKGIVGPLPIINPKVAPARLRAAPGEVLVVARPLSFWERLLYPLEKE